MGTGLAPHHRRWVRAGAVSRYTYAWSTVALLAGCAWVVVAVLETPPLPLLGLVAGLAAVGGTLLVRAPLASAEARHQYLTGALMVGGLVLVAVGIGHHLGAGLGTVALLAGSSRPVLHWVAGV